MPVLCCAVLTSCCAVLCCALLFTRAALPTLDIAEGALNKLIDTYKALLPKLGGYLTHAGEVFGGAVCQGRG
jgi:hypothetical protein